MKHWVNFTAEINGSIEVEGDTTQADAEKYVKRHLSFSCEAEGIDGEINDQTIEIETAQQAGGEK